MTNRQIAAQETRRKIVEAAKKIICEKGLANTSVDEITEACGVAKGSFYTYFKRKEEIVFELSRGMFDEILSNAKNHSGTFLDKLQKYMTEFASYIEKSSVKLTQEWIKNVVVPETIPNGYENNKLEIDLNNTIDLLQYGVETGELQKDSPVTQLAYIITDLLYGQMLCWCMSNGTYSYEKRTQEFCKMSLYPLFKNYLINKEI
ncbi:MAG: TetR/AcrR family transcriptional regulator [Clostridia bacterium]|nr:TetR/AcrR family transcriptional regulator [Clostridia bacterium]